MKIAIIGSRSFNDYNILEATLNTYKEQGNIEYSLMVSGGAKGADSLGELYAKNNNIPVKLFIPDWNLHGKKAGFLRNVDIINMADVVFAFWNGVSKGTKHSIDLAEKQGKPVYISIF